jgi:hypothetical protein
MRHFITASKDEVNITGSDLDLKQVSPSAMGVEDTVWGKL